VNVELWMWFSVLGLILAMLAIDLFAHRKAHEISVKEAAYWSLFWVTLGISFGGLIWYQFGAEYAQQYYAGFLIEKSLAVDNVFIWAIIFSSFAVPKKYQHRVLFWGILGVIVLRAIMIGMGTAIVSSFSWVLYLFAAFLIFTGIKMWLMAERSYDVGHAPVLKWLRSHFNVTDTLHGDRFWIRQTDHSAKARWYMTPLFMALVMIEVVDLVFAVDSVPAIFAITTDPFIVYTSNIFAILGLRALYFALAAMVDRFHYLKYALALLLVFIGSKIFGADALGLAKIPPAVSLGITFAILATGVVFSLWKTRGATTLPH